jgi:hypothetical protein
MDGRNVHDAACVRRQIRETKPAVLSAPRLDVSTLHP